MLAAASPAEAMAKGRQKARLFQKPVLSRSGAASRANAPLEAAADVPDAGLSALEQLEIGEDRVRLKDCLQELEERQLAAIRSAFLDGFTYEELAERASVPLGTMKSWIRRGLLKLRTCLER